MHTFDVQEILRRTLSGASRQVIARELGISKSTVQRYLDRIKQANLCQATTGWTHISGVNLKDA